MPLAVLIEDNPADARVIQEMVGDAVTIEWFRTLDEGVKRVVDHDDVEVVLLDLSLPDSEGIDSVSTMHLFDNVVPIVVLTGLKDEAASIQAVREGAEDYLVKGTFDKDRLMRSITFAIERAKR